MPANNRETFLSKEPVHFSVSQKVLFRHCDPAGIVFYPRMFEMVNDAIEAMFETLIGWPWQEMHATHGGPTVAISARFAAVCRHGDVLDFNIMIQKLGNSSLTLLTHAVNRGELKFSVENTMVCVNKRGCAVSWPEPVREKIEQRMKAS